MGYQHRAQDFIATASTTRKPPDAVLLGAGGDPPLRPPRRPDVIAMFGNRSGKSEASDRQLLRAHAISAAEAHRVTICLELLTARWSDADYQRRPARPSWSPWGPKQWLPRVRRCTTSITSDHGSDIIRPIAKPEGLPRPHRWRAHATTLDGTQERIGAAVGLGHRRQRLHGCVRTIRPDPRSAHLAR